MTTNQICIRKQRSTDAAQTSGFTRIDALAVICVCCLLFLLILPALARPGLNSKSLQCLSNVRQLTRAWQMYADDSQDRITYASTGSTGGGIPSSNPADPNNYAWSGAHMDFNAGNRANWDVNFDMNKRPLWPYTSRDASIYKCPEDQSSVSIAGVPRPRILSMNMNLYCGGFAPSAGSLDGTDGGWFANSYWIFSKTTQLASITPAKIFVFMDSRPDQINWSNFMTDMTGYSPINPALYRINEFPGFLHNNAGTFAFADGSGELHRWTDSRTTPPLSPNLLSSSFASPNNLDVAWLQDHSTRRK